MQKLRRVIFWAHLATGVTAGLIVLLMSVTGVLLTYEKQMIAWADARAYEIAPGPEATRLSVETLLERVRAVEPAVPTRVTVRSNPEAPAAIGYDRGRTLFVDPYTGAILGEGATGLRSFFHVVTDLHRWIGMSGENRTVGRAITGAANLGFLFLVTSGFYIWWPRKLTWKQFRNILMFRRGLSSKARDFNWHNVIGIWSLVPLFIVVLSGVVISYTWAGDLVYRLAGEEPPARRSGPPPQRGGEEQKPTVSVAGIDQHWTRAEQQVADWSTIALQLPKTDADPLAFSIDAGMGGQPQYRAQLTLDRSTGEVVRWEPFASLSSGRQMRSILRFAHTGEVLGFIGQTIAGIVSLGAAVLVYTGLMLTWRRFRAWLARRSERDERVGTELPAEGEAGTGT